MSKYEARLKAARHACDQIRTPGGISAVVRDGLNVSSELLDAMRDIASIIHHSVHADGLDGYAMVKASDIVRKFVGE